MTSCFLFKKLPQHILKNNDFICRWNQPVHDIFQRPQWYNCKNILKVLNQTELVWLRKNIPLLIVLVLKQPIRTQESIFTLTWKNWCDLVFCVENYLDHFFEFKTKSCFFFTNNHSYVFIISIIWGFHLLVNSSSVFSTHVV